MIYIWMPLILCLSLEKDPNLVNTAYFHDGQTYFVKKEFQTIQASLLLFKDSKVTVT